MFSVGDKLIENTCLLFGRKVESMGLLQRLVQKVLERKLQKERREYMKLKMQRAKLAGMINVEKKNREMATDKKND